VGPKRKVRKNNEDIKTAAAHNGLVAGSSPAGPTTHSRRLPLAEIFVEKPATPGFLGSCWKRPWCLERETARIVPQSLVRKILFLALEGAASLIFWGKDLR
jgi:hypothetical protein